MIDVPAVVRNKARAAGAEDWPGRLPALVSSLEAGWSITVGHPYEGGTEAFVADATRADGTPAVLKVLVPGTGNNASNEATVLRLVGGDGERIWRPAPDCGLPTGADKARWLADFIVTSWEELDRPCSEKTVNHALACAVRRAQAHRDERAVLVHGDVDQLNALQNDGGFRLVDPDGLLAEAEYDLGVLMRGDPVELLGGDPVDRARWLAARTGLDLVAIWEWGVVERLSTGLLCTRIHLQPLGRDTLAAAEAVAGLRDALHRRPGRCASAPVRD